MKLVDTIIPFLMGGKRRTGKCKWIIQGDTGSLWRTANWTQVFQIPVQSLYQSQNHPSSTGYLKPKTFITWQRVSFFMHQIGCLKWIYSFWIWHNLLHSHNLHNISCITKMITSGIQVRKSSRKMYHTSSHCRIPFSDGSGTKQANKLKIIDATPWKKN